MRNPFQPLQAVSLRLMDDEAQPQYPTVVLDFNEGRDLIVGEPQSEGTTIFVTPRETVSIELWRSDGLYRYTTRVQRRQLVPPSLVLDWPRDGERIQRRQHVRVSVDLSVGLTLDPPVPDLPESLEGVTFDLSAGGMRVKLPVMLPVDTTLAVRFPLPGRGPVTCRGRVVRSGADAEDGARRPRFWGGISFSEVTELDRRDITKYVSLLQLEYRRRGVL